METAIQTIIMILALTSIGVSISEHGETRTVPSNERIGFVISMHIAFTVLVIIFWDPTTIPDVVAWISTIAVFVLPSIYNIIQVITRKPDNARITNTTQRTIRDITLATMLLAACTVGVLN